MQNGVTTLELLKQELGEAKINSLLDVACGQGHFLDALFNSMGEIKAATGVDPEADILKMAEASFKDRLVTFVTGTGEALAFPDDSFDAVSIANALHHVVDVPQTLAEMVRVLKPGGWFIMNEMHQDDLTQKQTSHRLFHHFVSKTDRLRGVSHNATWHRQEVLDFIKPLNLQNLVTIEYSEPEPDGDQSESINMMQARLKERVELFKGKSEYSELKSEADAICERLEKVGVASPTEWLIIGKK